MEVSFFSNFMGALGTTYFLVPKPMVQKITKTTNLMPKLFSPSMATLIIKKYLNNQNAPLLFFSFFPYPFWLSPPGKEWRAGGAGRSSEQRMREDDVLVREKLPNLP